MAYEDSDPDALINSTYPISDPYDETLSVDNSGTEITEIRERTIRSARIPGALTGLPFDLTGENTHVRFFGGDHAECSRAVVDLGDGDPVSIPFGVDFLLDMVRDGFPEKWPKQLDETDRHFLFALKGKLL